MTDNDNKAALEEFGLNCFIIVYGWQKTATKLIYYSINIQCIKYLWVTKLIL